MNSPSTGKTVAIVGTVPVALEDVLWTILHEIWGLEWASPRFISSLVLVAIFVTAGLMHQHAVKEGRSYEKRQNTGGDSSSASGVSPG